MITRRVLPPEEWSRIADRPPFATGGLPDPEHWRIVVVERDGVIVASTCLFDSVHWDLFSIDEAERSNPVVVRELVEGGVDVMREFNIDLVHTTIPLGRPDLTRQLERLGFHLAPGELYYFERD